MCVCMREREREKKERVSIYLPRPVIIASTKEIKSREMEFAISKQFGHEFIRSNLQIHTHTHTLRRTQQRPMQKHYGETNVYTVVPLIPAGRYNK